VARMIVLFSRSNSFISRLIQKRTACDWSHVGFLDGDSIIHSKGALPCFFGIHPEGTGVIRSTLDEFRNGATEICAREIQGDIDAWRLVFQMLLLSRDNPFKEHCAEAGGDSQPQIPPKMHKTLTPRDFFIMSHPIDINRHHEAAKMLMKMSGDPVESAC